MPRCCLKACESGFETWTLNANCDLDSVSFPNSSAKLPEALPLLHYVLILACSASWRRWHQSEPTSHQHSLASSGLRGALSLLPHSGTEQQPLAPSFSPQYHEKHDTKAQESSGCRSVPAGDPLTLICSCVIVIFSRDCTQSSPMLDVQFDWLIHSRFFPCWKK